MNKKKLVHVAILATWIIAPEMAFAALDANNIPSTALSKDGKSVYICHFNSSGYPGSYEKKTVKKKDLSSYTGYPKDIYSSKSGECPDSGWSYLGTYNSSTGKPDNMTDMSSQLPADIRDKVLAILPEGRNISANPALITDDRGANILLLKNAHVKVAFITEGAGYQNALGFFQFTADDLTNADFKPSDKIIFPNFSTDALHFGDTVDLGDFTAGTAIGFTVAANAWQTDSGEVNPLQSTDRIFRTIKALNPEANNDYKAHTVLLSSPQDEVLILAIEDLNRTPGECDNDYGYCSDEDFNDAVLAIFVTPFDAVDRGDINCLSNCDNTDPDPETPIDPEEPPVVTPSQTGFSGRINWREKSDVKKDSANNANDQTAIPPAGGDVVAPGN